MDHVCKESKNNIQLDLNIISAQGLKRSRFGGKIQAYALAWINPHTRLATHVDMDGDVDPSWNTTMTFFISKHLLSKETSCLISIEIYNKGHLIDTLLGTVGVLVSNLLNRGMCHGGTQLCALQIRRPSGRAHGILNIGSMIVDPIVAYDDLQVSNNITLAPHLEEEEGPSLKISQEIEDSGNAKISQEIEDSGNAKISQEKEDSINGESYQQNVDASSPMNNNCQHPHEVFNQHLEEAIKTISLEEENMVNDQLCTINTKLNLLITNIKQGSPNGSILDENAKKENGVILSAC
eukprot:c3061_g1_i1 orf=485-1366(+)